MVTDDLFLLGRVGTQGTVGSVRPRPPVEAVSLQDFIYEISEVSSVRSQQPSFFPWLRLQTRRNDCQVDGVTAILKLELCQNLRLHCTIVLRRFVGNVSAEKSGASHFRRRGQYQARPIISRIFTPLDSKLNCI